MPATAEEEDLGNVIYERGFEQDEDTPNDCSFDV